MILYLTKRICTVPLGINEDITRFIEAFEKEPPDMKNLGLSGVTVSDITDLLKKIYGLK